TTYFMLLSLRNVSTLRAKGLKFGQYFPRQNWCSKTTSLPTLSHSNLNFCCFLLPRYRFKTAKTAMEINRVLPRPNHSSGHRISQSSGEDHIILMMQYYLEIL
ncbi:unnamed protein product, partial [Meganyctiphanes norvegica]